MIKNLIIAYIWLGGPWVWLSPVLNFLFHVHSLTSFSYLLGHLFLFLVYPSLIYWNQILQDLTGNKLATFLILDFNISKDFRRALVIPWNLSIRPTLIPWTHLCSSLKTFHLSYCIASFKGWNSQGLANFSFKKLLWFNFWARLWYTWTSLF